MQKTKQIELTAKDIQPIAIFLLVLFITWTFMHGADHLLEMTPAAMGKYYDYKWVIIAHITAGGGSILLGLIQFWKKLRNYSWKIHRIIGILYLLAVLVSGLSALILAFTTAYEVNLPYAFALQIWVTVWISTTAIAYFYAIRKRFKLHEEWMNRSYIVTIAFVISGLILKIPFIQSLGSFGEISTSLIWFGWTVPMYIYEIIRSSRSKARA